MIDQPFLYTKIVAPLLTKYEEIRWFADPEVEITQEGIASSDTTSWTHYLTQQKQLPVLNDLPVNTKPKYIELERMLQSIVCFNILLQGTVEKFNTTILGRDEYDYWVQHQKTDKLREEDFCALSIMTRKICENNTVLATIEACLVYSDLGKTPTARRKAKEQGIIFSDHDDLMKAVFANPKETIYKIIPSFKNLPPEVQNSIIATYDAVPLHWAHVTHLEGGNKMFTALFAKVKSGQCTNQVLEQAFIIQISDVAAANAHTDLNGSISFNNATYLRYNSAFNALKNIFVPSFTLDTQQMLTLVTEKYGERLGFTIPLAKKSQILTRIGAFLRLTTKESGSFLIEAAKKVLTDNDWEAIEIIFGIETGINIWNRNPTYIPAVLLNLFNAPATTDAIKYEHVLSGAVWIAKFCSYYSENYKNSSEPLCFNSTAAIAKTNVDLFLKKFDPESIEFKKPNEPTIKDSFLEIKLNATRILFK
jgi:hypothetical protein